jgi:hypothetical protein
MRILLAAVILGSATLISGQGGVRKAIFKADSQLVGRVMEAR